MRLVLNTMKKLLTITPILIALCGCVGVPATSLKINPTTGEFTIKGPKDTHMTNVIAEFAVPNKGTFKITIGSYSSQNSPDVIAAVAAGQAQNIDSLTKLSSSLAQAVAAGATKAAIP